MEILQTTAKVQQSQTSMPKNGATELQSTHNVNNVQKAQINENKIDQLQSESRTSKTNSQEQMDALIEKLNRSLDPFNTTLRFGFDNRSEDFYVSVIDTQTNKMLRRFPIEQAEQLLPKMQEVNGLLFDQKG